MIGGPVARHTVGIIRAPKIDDGHGNEDFDWGEQAETESHGWAVDAGATAEDTTNRDGDSIEYTLRGPYRADVLATDRVRFEGDVFLIEGAVMRQPGPSALTSHTIIRLIRWAG